MSRHLSFNTRKILVNQLGESAGREVAELFQHLLERVEALERTKVDVTPFVPGKRLTETLDATTQSGSTGS